MENFVLCSSEQAETKDFAYLHSWNADYLLEEIML